VPNEPHPLETVVAKPLIIVESPTKAKTIKKFLPARYVVKASVGHVRDLPKSTLGVDVLNGFSPRYLTIKGKGDVIKDLKAAAKSASEVYLATDPDREGEAIAWHLAELLKLENPKRIELHEITKDAALAALKDAHPIDMPRVNAQQARRILDRLVGYKISPLLWAKVRSGLSAGRVQSVAVRLIVDRERDIRAFTAREYWTITAQLQSSGSPIVFPADLFQIDGEKAEIGTGEAADAIMKALAGAEFRVATVKTRETRRNPAPPFTTSTLQQEASRKLKFRVRKTMQIAQALYEGVDLGGKDGTQGLITYMRTDSTRIADSARDAARDFVTARFGPEFYGGGRQYKIKEGAQDAHEAIRPTSALLTPESLAGVLKRDELRLYQLIWERFVASQMAPAVFDQTTVDIKATDRFTFRATGSVLKFAGYTAVYEEGMDDAAATAETSTGSGQAEPLNTKSAKARPILPKTAEGEALDPKSIDPKQHFTEPPPRFTEATLVRALEENGIGRPSTYSAIVETIQARGYVEQLDRRFHPTEIGESVNELLEKHFPDIVDLKFTASMEGQLDTLAETGGDWAATAKVLGAFYTPFEKELAEAERVLPKFEQRDEPTDEVCVKCGKPMVIKTGRFGRFMSCTGYPECKTTKPILKDTGVICPKDGGMIAERKSRKGRTFYGCANYPACDFVSWDKVAAEKCAVCGDYVVEKVRRGGNVSYVCHTDKTHATGIGKSEEADDAESELETV
jgi:DNA topoisomerase-1